jgi:hypothetical protein
MVVSSLVVGLDNGAAAQRKKVTPCMVTACKKASRSASDENTPWRISVVKGSGDAETLVSISLAAKGVTTAVFSPFIRRPIEDVQSMRPLSIFQAAISTASFANILQVTASFFTSAGAFANLFQIVGVFLQPDFASTSARQLEGAQGYDDHDRGMEKGKAPIGKAGALELSVVCRQVDQKSDNRIILIKGQFFDIANLEIIKKHFPYKKFVHIPVVSHIAD